MPDLANVIRQAEKIRNAGRLGVKPVESGRSSAKEKGPAGPDGMIRYEVLMTLEQLRQMERMLDSLRGGLLTATQLASYLQISDGHVYELANSGRIPAIRLGRQWRFKKDHIDKWLDEHARTWRRHAPPKAAGLPGTAGAKTHKGEKGDERA